MIFLDDATIKTEVITALGEEVPIEAQILAADPDPVAVWVLMDLLCERGWRPSSTATAKGDAGDAMRVIVREAVAHAILRMGPGARGELRTMLPPDLLRKELLGSSVAVMRYWPVNGRVELRLKVSGIGQNLFHVGPGDGREVYIREDGRTVFRGLLLSIGGYTTPVQPVGMFAVVDMVCTPMTIHDPGARVIMGSWR